MFQPSRDDARRFLFDTWKKQQSGQPLTDLERLAAAIMLDHPEYLATITEEFNANKNKG